MENDTLAEKAAAKEKKLLDLIDGCSTLLNKLGTSTSDVHSWYTTHTRIIEDILGFKIVDRGPNTMYGGNSLDIGYRGKGVLSLYYWNTSRTDPSYEVYHHEGGVWEKHLEALIKNVDEEVKKQAELKKHQDELRKQQEAEAAHTESMNKNLQDRIKRLGPYLQ